MSGRAYYNEFDPHAAAWLRELIKAGLIMDGEVDERSITEVSATDVVGFTRVHWFAGIGGWDYALRLAGWPEDLPVWTGSCPCQPFSTAGKRKGTADDRHIWPEMFRLVSECRPERVFGEQVESAIRHGWLDGVFTDLEGEGYTCGAAVLGAHSVSAPHIRQRLFWVADAECEGAQSVAGRIRGNERQAKSGKPQSWCATKGTLDGCSVSGMAEPASGRLPGRDGAERTDGSETAHGRWLGDAGAPGLPSAERQELPGTKPIDEGRATGEPGRSPWADCITIACRDGKARRVAPGVPLLAHGIPGRVAQLRGLGNAIVPQVAAAFIEAYIETRLGRIVAGSEGE